MANSGKERAAPTELKRAVYMWKLYTGKTQQDLAGQLGIKPSYLSSILSGGRSGQKYLAAIERITEKYDS